MKNAAIQFLAVLCLAVPGFADGPQKYNVTGTVFQKTEAGVLVKCEPKTSAGNKKAKGIVFVTGNVEKYFSGGKISVIALEDGTYKYVTVDGAESVIQKLVAP